MQHSIGPFKRQDDAFCRDPRSIGFLVPHKRCRETNEKVISSKVFALSPSLMARALQVLRRLIVVTLGTVWVLFLLETH